MENFIFWKKASIQSTLNGELGRNIIHFSTLKVDTILSSSLTLAMLLYLYSATSKLQFG